MSKQLQGHLAIISANIIFGLSIPITKKTYRPLGNSLLLHLYAIGCRRNYILEHWSIGKKRKGF